MIALKEKRPDSTGLARAILESMTAPAGARTGQAAANEITAKTWQQIAEHKRRKDDEAPLTELPGMHLAAKNRPGLRPS